MDSESRRKIEARVHEIDEWLRDIDASEMTEGVLFYAPDTAEITELHQERERLRQELAKAA